MTSRHVVYNKQDLINIKCALRTGGCKLSELKTTDPSSEHYVPAMSKWAKFFPFPFGLLHFAFVALCGDLFTFIHSASAHNVEIFRRV